MKKTTKMRLEAIITISENRYIGGDREIDVDELANDFTQIIAMCKNALHEDPVEDDERK